MSTLFELTDEILELENWLDRCDDEGIEFDATKDDAVWHYLQCKEDERDSKLDGYASLVRKLSGELEIAERESAEWKAKAESRKRKIYWLKQSLLEHMSAVGQKKIDTGRHKFSVCKNGGYEPLDIAKHKLPEEYWVQPDPVVDNDKIRQELKSGGKVEGCRLLPRGSHVRIS